MHRRNSLSPCWGRRFARMQPFPRSLCLQVFDEFWKLLRLLWISIVCWKLNGCQEELRTWGVWQTNNSRSYGSSFLSAVQCHLRDLEKLSVVGTALIQLPPGCFFIGPHYSASSPYHTESLILNVTHKEHFFPSPSIPKNLPSTDNYPKIKEYSKASPLGNDNIHHTGYVR